MNRKGEIGMTIREVTPADRAMWLKMRLELWPGNESEHGEDIDRYFSPRRAEPLMTLVAENADGTLCGFAELSIRLYAEGCLSDHVGYLEGWFVSPSHRKKGVGRALIDASIRWARGQGCTEFASDTEWDNMESAKAHAACGFEEAGVIRCFRRSIEGHLT